MPEEYVTPASWLLDAMILINRIPENSPREAAVNKMARKIVRMIEADPVTPPGIFRDRSNCVHIEFIHKKSEIEFVVSRPDMFRAEGRSYDGKRWGTHYSLIATRDFAESVRRAIGWLYPGRNNTSPEGILETVEVARR